MGGWGVWDHKHTLMDALDGLSILFMCLTLAFKGGATLAKEFSRSKL